MLLDTYESRGLLFNTNLKESSGQYAAYRGELVLTLGEVGDALGHRKPPTATIKSTVVLAADDRITFFSGSLDDLADLPQLVDHYAADFAPDANLILFVVNLKKPLQIDIGTSKFKAIPMNEGLVWTELTEMAGLEKGDFKGQSALEKVVTLAAGLADYKAKGEQVDFATAMSHVDNSLRRDARGPV